MQPGTSTMGTPADGRSTDTEFGNYPNDYPLGDASDRLGGAV